VTSTTVRIRDLLSPPLGYLMMSALVLISGTSPGVPWKPFKNRSPLRGQHNLIRLELGRDVGARVVDDVALSAAPFEVVCVLVHSTAVLEWMASGGRK
jgi:hypothetical protein